MGIKSSQPLLVIPLIEIIGSKCRQSRTNRYLFN